MLSEPRMNAPVGTVLEGAYRITRLIGEGGMGAVYEAVQLRLNKLVAIKLMARDLAANREALARFHREAEITSHLGHPHLVNVIDFGQAESGEPYLVMEYLEGEDLDQRLGRCGTVPIDLAVHITKQTASALGAAHAQGVVLPVRMPYLAVHPRGDQPGGQQTCEGTTKTKSALTRAALRS